MAAAAATLAAPTVSIKADIAGPAESSAKVVTAATFDPKRVVFEPIKTDVVSDTPDVNYDHIPLKYQWGPTPGDSEDPGLTFKWTTPIMVSPQGFATRTQQGKKKLEWSFMLAYVPDDKPDWDDEVLKRMAADPEYKAFMEKRHQEAVARSKEELDREVAALNTLSDALVEKLTKMKASPISKGKLKNYSAETFGRIPYAKPSEDGTPPRYTMWLKLFDMVINGETKTAKVVWADGTPIPKVARRPKPGEEPMPCWRDLIDKRLTLEVCFTIRGIFIGNSVKPQLSANTVIIHTVNEPEMFDPLINRTKTYAANDDKAKAVKRNQEKLRAMKASGPARSGAGQGEEEPATGGLSGKSASMASEEDDGVWAERPVHQPQPKAAPKAAPKAEPKAAPKAAPPRTAPVRQTTRTLTTYKRQPVKQPEPEPEPEEDDETQVADEDEQAIDEEEQ
jgi:hypothetical protein